MKITDIELDKILNLRYDYNDNTVMQDLVGKVFVDHKVTDDKEFLIFKDTQADLYVFYHMQDCCEYVSIEDITGDLDDLLETPILLAEESTSQGNSDDYDSFTWTFYKFATIKGYVDVRWLGSSNGYYSESVSLIKFNKDESK